nr:MAG: formate dehydrogenase [Hyphomicrobiales bacterium]
MNEERLVKMANQIADFFRLKPEEEAVAGAADHIVKFWDPRMRKQMASHLANGGEGLNPLALEAAKRACPAAS